MNIPVAWRLFHEGYKTIISTEIQASSPKEDGKQ